MGLVSDRGTGQLASTWLPALGMGSLLCRVVPHWVSVPEPPSGCRARMRRGTSGRARCAAAILRSSKLLADRPTRLFAGEEASVRLKVDCPLNSHGTGSDTAKPPIFTYTTGVV